MTQAAPRIPKSKPPAKPKPNAGFQKDDVAEPSVMLRDMGSYKMPMAKEYEPAWRDVLKRSKYPTDVVVIDFETYFDDEYSMGSKKTALSTVEYVMDDRFETLCVSALDMKQPFLDPDDNTHCWMHDQVEDYFKHLQDQYGENLERCTVVAQNAAFDITVLIRRYGITPKYVIDLLGLARAWQARAQNDLDSLCDRHGLKSKGDTKQFKGVTFRKRYVKPKSRKKGPKLPVQAPAPTDKQIDNLIDYANNDVAREWELFTILLPRLSNPATELRVMQHTLELFWHPVLKVDYDKGRELATLMDAEIDKVIETARNTAEGVDLPHDITRDTLKGNTFDELMEAALQHGGYDAEPYRKVAHNCNKGWKIACSKSDPQREDLETHEDALVSSIMLAKAAMDSWPNHVSRVERIMAMARACGDKLPVPLKYHGAHTGRWSGGERINLQNLGSRGHELVSAVREMLLAPPDHKLVIADASQIEARVLAWIAGQTDLCERFANGEEIYCGFAAKVLGIPVRKPRPGGIPAVEARHTWARNSVGKVGILGCGYGMGWRKTISYSGGSLDEDTAQKLVSTYRNENDRIVQFWKDLEAAFIFTAKFQQPTTLRGLSLRHDPDCDVIVTLPSGRELKYQQVRLGEGKFGGESARIYNAMARKWEHTWGGSLTENVVQAISRDILWDAMHNMEVMGHHVALHVHDELVASVPEERADAALSMAIRFLSSRPEWGPDLPLGAEGKISDYYTSH